MAPRLLILGDRSSFVSATLIEAALRLARAQGIDVVGVCDAGRRPRRHGRAIARAVFAAGVQRAFDADRPLHWQSLVFPDLHTIARRFGARIIVPPGRNVNDPGFVRTVADELRPDWGLSLGCGQIFRRDLLAALRHPVNYHNGLLPAYRGAGATAWSVFNDEPITGFTFHMMNERLDAGPILLQGTLPVPPDPTVPALEWQKTVEAARRMPDLFTMLERGDPGEPQTGTSSYFDIAGWRRARTIDDPTAHTWHDLERRIRAFDYIAVHLDGTLFEVTKLRRVTRGQQPGPLAFRTSDGIVADPIRLLHLPPALYRLYRPWWPGKPKERA